MRSFVNAYIVSCSMSKPFTIASSIHHRSNNVIDLISFNLSLRIILFYIFKTGINSNLRTMGQI